MAAAVTPCRRKSVAPETHGERGRMMARPEIAVIVVVVQRIACQRRQCRAARHTTNPRSGCGRRGSNGSAPIPIRRRPACSRRPRKQGRHSARCGIRFADIRRMAPSFLFFFSSSCAHCACRRSADGGVQRRAPFLPHAVSTSSSSSSSSCRIVFGPEERSPATSFPAY